MVTITSFLPSRSAILLFRVLFHRPGRAVAIAYWYLTRRRVRARHRLREAAASTPFAYDAMIRSMEGEADIVAHASDRFAAWAARPYFSILLILPNRTDRHMVEAAIRSVDRQCYDRWELVIAGAGAGAVEFCDHRRARIVAVDAGTPSSAFAGALGAATGSFIIPLAVGTELAPTALFRFAEAVEATPDAVAFYGDQDSINRYGNRSEPWLKPQWNAEMILALDFASHACAMRTADVRAVTDRVPQSSQCPAYALFLEVTRNPEREPQAQVTHIPHVVAHVRSGDRADDPFVRAVAVAAHVAEAGASASPGPFGTVTVRWPIPVPSPPVTILVPTRDRVDLLSACIDSVLSRTDYDNYQLVIIDNGSTEPATSAYFTDIACDPRVEILPCAMPYNYSAINNYAAERVAEGYLCFLNNDTVVTAGDWLSEMIRYAVRAEVGAVGAKLLYEDDSIQHAGVVMGLGNAAGHSHRGLAAGDPGYFAQAHAAHYASAVTAACLVVAKRKFDAVGGFDAEHLQIAYNDVDLCLKLGRKGWRNVYAPQAVVYHLEGRSRGADLSPAHLARYMRELDVLQTRWNTRTVVDPMHHPSLDRSSETYRFRF